MNIYKFTFIEELGEQESSFLKTEFAQHALEQLGVAQDLKPFGFVAKESGKIVGVVWGKLIYGALSIKDLIVAKECRGKRLGSRLLEKAMQYGREQGCKLVYLETLNFQAKGFYQKHGFEIDFERTGYNSGVSLLHMSRKL